MKERRIAIGGLLLPEIGSWEFNESEGMIIGRRDNSPGWLEIIHASQDTLPQPVTHEFCLTVLRMMIKVDEEPTDRQMYESVCGPYGAATFIRASDKEPEVLRTWYSRRPPGLIYGIFTCPQQLAQGAAYEMASRQCARIMGDVLFDRVSWGADDDPLTQVLLANFVRLENERR